MWNINITIPVLLLSKLNITFRWECNKVRGMCIKQYINKNPYLYHSLEREMDLHIFANLLCVIVK